MAIECLVADWNLFYNLLLVLCIPLIAVILGGIAWLVSWIVVLLPRTEYVDPHVRNIKIWKVAVFVVSLGYFNMATMFFSMFSCTSHDPSSGHYYLNMYQTLFI